MRARKLTIVLGIFVRTWLVVILLPLSNQFLPCRQLLFVPFPEPLGELVKRPTV
jgi:hypothetical protein